MQPLYIMSSTQAHMRQNRGLTESTSHDFLLSLFPALPPVPFPLLSISFRVLQADTLLSEPPGLSDLMGTVWSNVYVLPVGPGPAVGCESPRSQTRLWQRPSPWTPSPGLSALSLPDADSVQDAGGQTVCACLEKWTICLLECLVTHRPKYNRSRICKIQFSSSHNKEVKRNWLFPFFYAVLLRYYSPTIKFTP